MHQQRLPQHTHSYVDSCAFDPGGEEEACSRRLLGFASSGGIHLEIAHSVGKEIDHPNTPPDVKRQARQFIFTNAASLTAEQSQRRSEIRKLLQGNAAPQKHQSDADHLFDLEMHGGGYFITTDPRILRLSDELFRRYFITALKPCDYEKLIS